MRLADIGEFALIERLAAIVGEAGDDVLVGIGDDAAIVAPPAAPVVLTADMLIDGVHFDLQAQPAESIGHRAMTANISDVASMASTPKYALVCLGLPGELPVETIEDIYKGLVGCASRYGVAVVGGDITASPVAVISVALVGEAGPAPARRNQARDGDKVLVTGYPGSSAAGLAISRSPELSHSDDRKALLESHLHPLPRVAAAAAAAAAGVRCMQDVSDGVARDLGHICKASGLGAVIAQEDLPESEAFSAYCRETSSSPEELILGGGEDFELLLTCSTALVGPVQAAIGGADGLRSTAIGFMTADLKGVWLRRRDGSLAEVGSKGYEHFG